MPEIQKNNHVEQPQAVSKAAFVTNFCTHYEIRLFEMLAQRFDIEYYFTGGYETYWAKENKQWTGDFYGRSLPGFFLMPGFKVSPGLSKLFSRKFRIFIKTIDDKFALPFVFLIAKLSGRPFILWTGIWDHPKTAVHRLSRGFTKFIYRKADAIVVYGKHIEDYLAQLGVDKKKIFIAPHALDNDAFSRNVSLEEIGQLKNTLGVADKKIVLYVGRLEPCKGLNYLIEALSLLNKKEVHLLIIGQGSQRETLESECKKRSLSYQFLEHIPNGELYRYYALADIFILPSITTPDFKEPWGLVVNEAMNQACPVIATNAVGAAAGGLVEDGKTGFIVNERDPLALKEAIRVLIEDENLAEKMGKKGLEKIQQWTYAKMCEGFAKAIEYAQKPS